MVGRFAPEVVPAIHERLLLQRQGVEHLLVGAGDGLRREVHAGPDHVGDLRRLQDPRVEGDVRHGPVVPARSPERRVGDQLLGARELVADVHEVFLVERPVERSNLVVRQEDRPAVLGLEQDGLAASAAIDVAARFLRRLVDVRHERQRRRPVHERRPQLIAQVRLGGGPVAALRGRDLRVARTAEGAEDHLRDRSRDGRLVVELGRGLVGERHRTRQALVPLTVQDGLLLGGADGLAPALQRQAEGATGPRAERLQPVVEVELLRRGLQGAAVLGNDPDDARLLVLGLAPVEVIREFRQAVQVRERRARHAARLDEPRPQLEQLFDGLDVEPARWGRLVEPLGVHPQVPVVQRRDFRVFRRRVAIDPLQYRGRGHRRNAAFGQVRDRVAVHDREVAVAPGENDRRTIARRVDVFQDLARFPEPVDAEFEVLGGPDDHLRRHAELRAPVT